MQVFNVTPFIFQDQFISPVQQQVSLPELLQYGPANRRKTARFLHAASDVKAEGVGTLQQNVAILAIIKLNKKFCKATMLSF
jgi:hypothetical protein